MKITSILRGALLSLLVVSLSAASANEKKPETSAASKTSAGKIVLTSDNVVVLDTDFNEFSTANLAQVAKSLDAKLPSGEPLYLVIDSPGGLIDAGLNLIENLNALNREVHTISVFAASMGFQTVQGLKKRYVLENGTLMSHKARGGFSGEFPGQLDSRYSYYLKRVNRMNEKAVKRTNGKHTLQSYANLIENEYWCDGEDCVKEGFADAVAAPSCDQSLNGTRNSLVDKFMFMGHTVEIFFKKSACPINTGVLDVLIFIDGEKLYQTDLNKEVIAKKEEKTNKSTSYLDFYSSSSTPKTALTGLSLETVINLQKLVETKVNDVTNRRVIKGY